MDFLNQLFPLVTFDIFPTDYIYALAFNLTNDEPVSDLFESVGYGFKMTINNIGSLLIYILIIPVWALVIFIVKKKCCIKKIKDFGNRKWQSFIWNGVIDFYV